MLIARAPVRISFGGGGTDLAAYYAVHGGFVVSAAVARYSYVVVRPSPDRSIRVSSANYHRWATLPSEPDHSPADDQPPGEAQDLRLPRAAVERFLDFGLGSRGVDLMLASEVPPGTGLGSSSAMAVALVRGLAAHLQIAFTPAEAAELACGIEIDRLKMPIGKQDQYASAFGGLNTVEFSAEGVRVRPLDLDPPIRDGLNQRLMLFATGHSRDSATILHQQRSDTGAKPVVVEALHRLKALAHEMRAVLVAARRPDDLDEFAGLLDRAWREKRGLSGAISTSAIDEWYAAARAAGALGGKIAGAGGGGFMLLYAPPEHQPRVRAALRERGLDELPFDFDLEGAHVYGMTPHTVPGVIS